VAGQSEPSENERILAALERLESRIADIDQRTKDTDKDTSKILFILVIVFVLVLVGSVFQFWARQAGFGR